MSTIMAEILVPVSIFFSLDCSVMGSLSQFTGKAVYYTENSNRLQVRL